MLRLSPSSNRLYVVGDDADVVIAEDEAWTLVGDVEARGQIWRVLTSGRAELYLSPSVATRFDPYVSTTALEIAENSPADAIVGQIEAVDPDGAVDRVELLDGPWSHVFTLDAQRRLRVARPDLLDFESAAAVMPLRFRVTDDTGLSADGEVVVRLTDVNEPPRFVGVDGIGFEWPEGGYDRALLTALLAVDADADETLTYRLITADVPFLVEPETGTVRIDGALDFEGQAQYVLALEVRDQAGLTDTASVTVDVIDADTFPQTFTLSFVSRGQDIQTPQDPCWIDPFNVRRNINRAPGNPATIVDPFAADGSTYAIDMHGNFEVDWQLQPSRGRLDTAAVAEVVLELPDEIQAGQPVDLRMLTRARSTAVSGETPGMFVRFFTIFRDTRFAAWYCSGASMARPDLIYDRDCAVIGEYVIDPEEPNGEPLPFRSEREAPSLPFTAVDSDGPDRAVTGERVDFFEYMYRINSVFEELRRITGVFISANGISLSYDAGDYQADLEIYPFYMEVPIRLDLRTRIDLIQLGVQARLTLEDGTVFDLEVPTCRGQGVLAFEACLADAGALPAACVAESEDAQAACEAGEWPTAQLDIPADADVDGDGQVAVDLDFDLSYDLTQDFNLVWQLGGAAALGEALMRFTLEGDRENPTRITNRYGPQARVEVVAEIDENCPVSSRPNYPVARRRGTLDLRAP